MERPATKEVLQLKRRIAELQNQIMDERFSLDHVRVLESEIQEVTQALTQYANLRLAGQQGSEGIQDWLKKEN
jgi:hypothetical protein